jgi:hypothetical protein
MPLIFSLSQAAALETVLNGEVTQKDLRKYRKLEGIPYISNYFHTIHFFHLAP